MVSHDEFAAYYTARAGQLRSTAYLLCGDWHLAEDLTRFPTVARRHRSPLHPLSWRRPAACRPRRSRQPGPSPTTTSGCSRSWRRRCRPGTRPARNTRSLDGGYFDLIARQSVQTYQGAGSDLPPDAVNRHPSHPATPGPALAAPYFTPDQVAALAADPTMLS